METERVVHIRRYVKADWPVVLSWWEKSGEVAPLEAMMPLSSSFIAEIDGTPALSVAVYFTNTPEIAWAENFVGNPDCRGEARREASRMLSDHIAEFAKKHGYKRLMCMTEKPVLVDRYIELGFTPTLSGVTTFVRLT